MKIIPTLLAFGLAVGSLAAPQATVPIDDGSLSLVASAAFSGVLRSGQSLMVSGTITNGTARELDAGTATIALGGSRMSTRAAFEEWLDPDNSGNSLAGTSLGTLAVGELAAGQVRQFSVTIPASSIRLPSHQPGAYPLAVRLVSDTIQVAFSHSVVVWTSDGSSSADVELAVVAPIVAPPSATGILTAQDLETLTAPGGMLDAQLSSAQDHGMAIGVDPMIIASIRLLGTAAPPSALEWLARLDASPELFSLAYADANLRLEARAGARSPLEPKWFPIDDSNFPTTPDNTPSPSGSPIPAGESAPTDPNSLVAVNGSIGGLAWLSDGAVSEKDLDFLARGGYTRSLVSSSALSHGIGRSPNVMVGEHELTVFDDEVSRTLRDAATATTDSEWRRSAARLAGLLSISALEHPGATIIAALGRESADARPSVNRTLGALESLSWVKHSSLAAAMELPANSATLAKSGDTSDRVSTVSKLLSSEAETSRFATIVDPPELVTGPERLALLALLSNTWAQNPAGWSSAAAAYLAENTKLRSSVRIPESSLITFPLEKGDLPIAVRNGLDFPVTVYVTAKPERALIDVLKDRVELTIEANSQAKAAIPVQSIANGEVRTKVSLSSVTGQEISTPTFVLLNVQAGWETAATVVLAIIVFVLFCAGVWRTVLRRRRIIRERSADARSTS